MRESMARLRVTRKSRATIADFRQERAFPSWMEVLAIVAVLREASTAARAVSSVLSVIDGPREAKAVSVEAIVG